MNKNSIIAIAITVCLTSCSWDPGGFKAQEKLTAQKKEEQIAYERRVKEDQLNMVKKQEEEKNTFETSHPEVEVSKIDIGKGISTKNKFAAAINSLDFVTRYPEAQTLDNVYVKVGNYNLTAKRFSMAVDAFSDECKRVSAYNGVDYQNACISSLAASINNFSAMLKNKNIPDKTKSSALMEATYGSYIDFGHAANLAKMHYQLCQQKGNQGYVEMVTTAVPCDGRGDVLRIYAAREMGLL